MCNFNVDFSKIFWGYTPDLHTGEGRRSPFPVWGSGGIAPRKFSKNQRWNCTFSFGFSNVWRLTPVAKQSSVCNSGAKIFFNLWRGGHSPMSPPSGYAPVRVYLKLTLKTLKIIRHLHTMLFWILCSTCTVHNRKPPTLQKNLRQLIILPRLYRGYRDIFPAALHCPCGIGAWLQIFFWIRLHKITT